MKALLRAILFVGCLATLASSYGQGGTIITGLLETPDTVRIFVYGYVPNEDLSRAPGRYELIDSFTFVDSYTFKVPSYRDMTIIYTDGHNQNMQKIIEGGVTQNFIEIDVSFRRARTSIHYKLNAKHGQFESEVITTGW